MVRRAFSTPYRPLRTLPMLSLFVVGVSVLASSSQSHGPARPRIEALAPVEVLSAGLRQPMGVAIDPTGVVLVADRRGGAVYAVGPSGVHARVAGLERPVGLAVEPTGRLLVVEEQRGRLLALDGGSLAVLAHGMRRPRWVAVAGDGTVYLSARGLRHQEGARGGHLHEEDDDRDERGRDAAGDVVLRLTPGGGLAVWADGFEDLEGLLVHGDTVLAAARGRVRSRHERDGVFQIPIQPDGSAGRVTRLSPASIETPVALAIDRLGALYVGAARLALPGTPGGAIGKIDPGVNIGRFAWRLQRPQGIALDEAGHLYVADGDDGSGRLLRFRAPAPPDVTAPAVTNQSPLLLGGRTEPVARVDALLNDAHLVATATPGGGFTLTLALQPNAANALAVSATAHEGRGLTGGATELTIVHDGVGPLITAMQPANGAFRSTRQPAIGASFGDAGAAVDPASVIVRLDGVNVTAQAHVTVSAFTLVPQPLAEGGHTLFVQVADRAGNAASASSAFVVDVTGPSVIGLSPADGTTVQTARPPVGAGFDDAGAGVDVASVRIALDGADRTGGAAVTAAGFSLDPGDLTPGAHALAITVADLAGNVTTASASFTVATVPGGSLPPDPATVAPPLDPAATATVASATAFLYTGANPIQTGVAPGTIAPQRAAVLRGRVLGHDGTALPGVTVRLPGHAELGQTVTRADGLFDLAVNGGGSLAVRYERAGFLPAERQVATSGQDYFWLPDVVLVQLDARATTIDLTSTAAVQVARGSVSADDRGTRQATVLFPGGTTARLGFDNRTGPPLSALTVRATEYTVGPSGPAAMPAPLPPSSGYTYAVELSVDEAIAAGAREVRFDRPVIVYVENFLGFRTGGIVPVGFFDREAGGWRASDNGRIVAIVGVTGGLADVDSDGDGIADDAATLAALGVTDAERQELAGLYSPGQGLWRVPLRHFSSVDFNWPSGPPLDSSYPKVSRPRGGGPDDNCCENTGSIIETQSQILGERVAITGTSVSLNYRSDRTPGRTVANVLEIPLSGPSVPASLRRIELEIQVAGQRVLRTFPAAPEQRDTFVWDGRDAYGRMLQGAQPVTIRLCYVYGGVLYKTPADAALAFARFGTQLEVGGYPPREERLCQDFRTTVGTFDARVQALGGWTLDVHHAYDPIGQALYLGDGRRRTARLALSQVIDSLALGGLQGLAVTPDGTLYGARTATNTIVRITPDGNVTPVAGTGIARCNGPSPSTQHFLTGPTGLAAGSADVVAVTALDDFGNPVVRQVRHPEVYIADSGCHQVHHLRAEGGLLFIETIVGNGTPGFDLGIPGLGGDGVPVNAVRLNNPTGLAVGPDGGLYIADTGNSRIRRIEPGRNGFFLNSIITTVAGTPAPGFSGDGGVATSAQLNFPTYLAVGDDGSLYIADTGNHRVRRVAPDGIISTFAGDGARGFGGDGSLATQAQLDTPRGLVWAPDGLYIADAGNRRVRRVTPAGIIETVVGNGASGSGGNGGPPIQAALVNPRALAFAPDRSLLIADDGGTRVVRSGLPGFTATDISIPSADGLELHRFDGTGRHLETRHSLTGETLYTFGYDAAGRLTTLTDGDGNVTRVERDGSGHPTAIVAPFGQRTALALDGGGYLASVTDPVTGPRGFTYHGADGLLATHTDPRGGVHRFTYDAQGHLASDENPDRRVTALARTDSPTGYQITTVVPPNRVSTYQVENLPTGEQRRIDTFPGEAPTEARIGTDGATHLVLPDGTTLAALEGPDPRFGMSVPVMTARTLTTPGGLISRLTTTRAGTLADPLNPLSLQSLSSTLSLNDRTCASTFTAASRTVTHTTPAGRQVVTTVDGQGRHVREEFVGLAPLSYAYDARGRLASVTIGEGADAETFTIEHGPDGYPAAFVDSLGQTIVRSTRDGAGRITSQTLADGQATVSGYDGNDNVVSVAPPGRPVHAMSYTPGDLLASYTPPDVGTGNTRTEYSYGADGRLSRITSPDGQTVDIGYDAAGRPRTVLFPAGQMSFAYDADAGRLATVTAPGGVTLSYTYDALLPTRETLTGPVTGTVDRTFDRDFFLTSETVSGTSVVSFGYDPDGLPVQAGPLTVRRDPRHGLVTGTTLAVIDDERIYNRFGEDTRYRVTAAGVDLFTVDYERDRFGRITRMAEVIERVPQHVAEYSYDARDRLVEVRRNGAVVVTYAYDGNGNRLSATKPTGTVVASHDAQDRLRQYGAAAYTYTATGDLLTRTVGSGAARYDYDALGNLRHVVLTDGRTIDYVIDGRNRRVGKMVDGSLVQGFLYRDDLRVVAELDGAGLLLSRFVYASRSNVPDYMERRGHAYRIVSDHLGSPRLVVDGSTGTVVQRLDYDEFGNVALDTNPGFQPFGFAGGLYDRDTRLVRFGARDYDAETGRWTAKDPVGFAGGDTNLYAYALNDPVNLTDPSGRWVHIVIGAAIGGGTDLLVQLAVNGGNWECVSVAQVIFNAALGGLTGGLNQIRVARNLQAARELAAARTAARLAQQVDRAAEARGLTRALKTVDYVKVEGQASTRPSLFNSTGRGGPFGR